MADKRNHTTNNNKKEKAQGNKGSKQGQADTPTGGDQHAGGVDEFHKFPRTRHILDAGGTGVAKDDLVRNCPIL